MSIHDDASGPTLDSLLDFFHVLPVGLISFRADGQVELINPAAIGLLSLEAQGRPADNVFALLRTSWPELETTLSGSPERLGRIVENHTLAVGSDPHIAWLSISVVRAEPEQTLMVLNDVTEKHRIEAGMRERERNLRTLFDSIDEGYCVAEMIVDHDDQPIDYRFIEVNPRFEEMTGLADAAGRTALELVPDLEHSWIEMYGRVGLGKEILRFEDGSEALGRWFDVFAMPVEPHGRLAVVFRDKTDRHRWEVALEESEAFTRRVLDNLFAFVGVLAPDGTLIEANRAPLEAAGIELSDVVGKKFWDCVWWSYSSQVQDRIRDAVEQSASGRVVRFDIPVRVIDDGRLWIDFQLAPLRDAEGVITHLVPSGLDLSERKAAEEQRVRLLESERRARQRTELLERNATHLAAATTVEDLAESVLRDLQMALGTTVTAVNILDGDAIRTMPSPAVRDEADAIGVNTRSRLIRVPLDADLPGPHSIRTNEVVHLDSFERISAMFPTFAEGMAELSVQSILAAPLRSGSGEVLGSLVVGAEESGWFDEPTLNLLGGIADQTGLALERTQLFEQVLLAREQEHAIAVHLQEALLPDGVVDHPDVDIAASYRAASDQLSVGGDWFDTYRWPSGEVGIVVGDVAGHDLDATVAMGRLRAAMAALVPLTDPRPAALLAALDHCAREIDGSDFVTAACVVVDAGRGEVFYATAGHPPPLIIDPDGSHRWLDDAVTPPAGHRFAGERHESSMAIEPGALLLLYSDGLIERRDEHIDASLDRLVGEGKALGGYGVDTIPDELIAALLVGHEPADDIIAVAARFEPFGAERTVRFRAGTQVLAPLRRDLTSWLERHRVDAAAQHDIQLAVGEAITNAIEHSYSTTDAGEVELHMRISSESLVVLVRDDGAWRPAGPITDGGRGLPIMQALSSHFERTSGPAGTTIEMHLPAPRDDAPSKR